MQTRTDNGNMRTLFDANAAPCHLPTDRATRALSRPAYPILKLDCRSPVEAPRRVLQAPVEITSKPSDNVGYLGKGASGVSSPVAAQRCFSPTQKCVSGKKDKRSMSALLKRHCGLNIPRSSISIKTSSHGLQSPKWLGSAGVTEEEGLVDKKNEKWVEAQDEKRRNSILGSVGFGRLR